jgi:diacylglycerol kinase (ATP)
MPENPSGSSGAELLETVCSLERVAIIFNPASGTEDSETRRATLETLARAAGLSCELAETDQDRGAAPLAREAVADRMERILISGGDGSVMEAAGAVAGTGVALAVLPGGTGNLLALNMGLPTDIEAAIRVGITGEAQPMDIGRANGAVFLIMAGMGLDAAMIRDTDRELKDRLGVLAYFVAALRNIRRPPVRYSITIDGRKIRRRAQTVLVANLGRITGGVELVPGADPEDGQLEVAILRAQELLDLGSLAWRALSGKARSDSLTEIHRGREIVIETVTPQPVQLDGNEASPTTCLKVSVEPGALLLVRAPRVDNAESSVSAAPGAVLSRHANVVAWSLLAGVGAAATIYYRARAVRSGENEPGCGTRHPALTGLAVGAVTGFLTSRILAAVTSTGSPAEAPSEVDDCSVPPVTAGQEAITDHNESYQRRDERAA